MGITNPNTRILLSITFERKEEGQRMREVFAYTLEDAKRQHRKDGQIGARSKQLNKHLPAG